MGKKAKASFTKFVWFGRTEEGEVIKSVEYGSREEADRIAEMAGVPPEPVQHLATVEVAYDIWTDDEGWLMTRVTPKVLTSK